LQIDNDVKSDECLLAMTTMWIEIRNGCMLHYKQLMHSSETDI
jgi:hypothetical protein